MNPLKQNSGEPQFRQEENPLADPPFFGNNRNRQFETPGPSNIYINNMAGAKIVFNFQIPRERQANMMRQNLQPTPNPRQNQVVGFNLSPSGSGTSSPESPNMSFCSVCSSLTPSWIDTVDEALHSFKGFSPNCQ